MNSNRSNITQLEILIHDASHGNGARKQQATQMIDQIRLDRDRWSIGLELFLYSSDDVAKLFGLSLLRDYLRSFPDPTNYSQRLNIRQSILSWVRETFPNTERIEPYAMNNVANILTLCIKCDFPENWPSAFDDILSFSEIGWIGIDLTTRIVADLDIEVVMFSESRTQDEINHNRIVKDAMRTGPILFNLVNFLTTSARQTAQKEESLSIGELCLNTLATMIGWIDIGLIVNDSILPQIYQFLQYEPLASAACGCLHELSKKGMDPSDKVQLLASIGIITILSELPFNPTTCEDETIEDDIGTIIDVIFLELISCWIEFENYVLKIDISEIENSPSNSELRSHHQRMGAIGQLTGEQLKLCVPVLMKVFSHGESVVSTTVLTAMKKLIAQIKKQQPLNAPVDQLLSEPILAYRSMYPEWFFVAADYIPQILSGIFMQLQYDVSFYESSLEADDDDEEIAAEVEAKNQMRQLFVSCCRICPLSCLELISNALSSIQQPLYSAPFPTLEAALRLVHAFGECGTQYQSLIVEGVFPSILQALHQSEIHRHHNPMVLLAYYEVATRYVSQSSIDTVRNVIAALVSTQGLRHSDGQLRCRSAFFMRKIAESLRDDSPLLLQAVGSFADLILTQTGAQPPLPEQAEMHLLEAVGLMTSARSCPQEGAIGTYVNNEANLQLGLLQEMLGSLVTQLQSLIADPTRVDRYGDQLSEIAAWKIGSLGSLTKGHSPKSHLGEVANLFDSALQSILPVICEFAKYKQCRSKSIIFLHRMVQCIGYRVLEPCSKCIGPFLQFSEPNDIDQPIQLLNQLMVEFGTTEYSNSVIQIIDPILLPIADRLLSIFSELQQLTSSSDQLQSSSSSSLPSSSSSSSSASVVNESNSASDTLEAEKLGILRHYLMFLQHIATYQIHPVYLSSSNVHRLPDLLNNIISGIQGGENDGIRMTSGLILRRSSLLCLTSLVSAWLSSSSTSSNIPVEVSSLLSNLICNQALPNAFRSFTSGSLNLSDAQVQGYVGEVANLIWTMSLISSQGIHQYINDILLPSLQWPSSAINEMKKLLNGADLGQMHTFREGFKKLIRKICR